MCSVLQSGTSVGATGCAAVHRQRYLYLWELISDGYSLFGRTCATPTVQCYVQTHTQNKRRHKKKKTHAHTHIYVRNEVVGDNIYAHLLAGREHDFPMLGDRPVVLCDLIVLGRVGVEVILRWGVFNKKGSEREGGQERVGKGGREGEI